ncbi:polyprenyl synthetase family protein [Thermodesulfobacteriota bacterium]
MDLELYLEGKRRLVEKALDEALPTENNRPAILHKAMRYSLFAGGKRIRPILAMAAAEVAQGRPERVLPLAVALECVHTYSLIHDDLPAMDDDDIRRGKPACHKEFGEAMAILSGDALLALAFEVLSAPAVVRVCEASRLIATLHELATASGSKKLVAGQVVDILSEGKSVNDKDVAFIVNSKTGALIRASLKCGALMAGGTKKEVELLSRFGTDLGAMFQIKDDLLDLEGDPVELGKAVRKDEGRGKATYPNLIGKEQTKMLMQILLNSALETLAPLGSRAEPLALIAHYLNDRAS